MFDKNLLNQRLCEVDDATLVLFVRQVLDELGIEYTVGTGTIEVELLEMNLNE